MILKTKEASKYIGVSINTLKTLANREKIKSYKTDGGHLTCYYCKQKFRCGCQEKDFMIEKIAEQLPLKEYKPEWDKEEKDD